MPTPEDHAFDARFYLHDPAEIGSPPVRYSVERMRQFSPENLSLMEFRSERDYELCAKIRAEHPLLGSLGYQFRREFHVTEDSRFFHKQRAERLKAGQLPLFEGKMIFQFDSGYAPGDLLCGRKGSPRGTAAEGAIPRWAIRAGIRQRGSGGRAIA